MASNIHQFLLLGGTVALWHTTALAAFYSIYICMVIFGSDGAGKDGGGGGGGGSGGGGRGLHSSTYQLNLNRFLHCNFTNYLINVLT